MSAETALTPAEAIERLREILVLSGRLAFVYPLDPARPQGPAMLGIGPETYVSAYDAAPDAASEDTSERFYFLDLSFESDLGIAATDGLESLQVLAKLPFTVPAEALDAVAQLSCVLNLMLPHGTFALAGSESEGQHQLVYRYVLRTRDRRIETPVLLELANSACFFIDRMADKLEAVALGLSSWEEALAAVELLLLTRPPQLELVPEGLGGQERE